MSRRAGSECLSEFVIARLDDVASFPSMTDDDDGVWTDDELDGEFPRGDGTAETEATVFCPHCGELNEIALDPGSGDRQEYVEDCQVCCQPWRVYVRYARDGSATLDVTDLDA